MTGSPRRIAIVGGGIAGIACSWELRKHSARNVRVDIYESESKLGGHANSVPFKGNGTSVDVDTGFIVMDEATYPRFNTFLGDLGIKTIPTDMSFGVTTTDKTFEWSSRSMGSFVATLTLLLSPWVWRLIFDIVRFSLFAEDILYERGTTPRRGEEESCPMSTPLESIGSYLIRQGYSSQFTTYFLIPMVAAPWCIDPDEFSRSFPARPLIHFM
ncbi:amine oxidase, partial [Metarhizium hybridum]